jgi:protein arginine kinase
MTLGEKEPEIVERLSKVVHQMIEHEKNARQKLLEKREPKVLFNHIGRAFGILANAHSISSKEAMNLLSRVRLAHRPGYVPRRPPGAVDELLLVTQPGHLQRAQDGNFEAEEREIAPISPGARCPPGAPG